MLTPLTEEERRILDFEGLWFRHAGAKERAIRTTFDVSPVRYYMALNALLGRHEAEAYAPSTVHRLRYLRDQRRR